MAGRDPVFGAFDGGQIPAIPSRRHPAVWRHAGCGFGMATGQVMSPTYLATPRPPRSLISQGYPPLDTVLPTPLDSRQPSDRSRPRVARGRRRGSNPSGAHRVLPRLGRLGSSVSPGDRETGGPEASDG